MDAIKTKSLLLQRTTPRYLCSEMNAYHRKSNVFLRTKFLFLDKECKPIADIGFVIDSSGSIGRSNWGRMKRFLKAMVSKLDVSPSATHISAVAYSNNPEVVIRFNNRQGTDEVNSAFDGMRWQRGFTFTDKALQLANSDLFQAANGMRQNVAKVETKNSLFICH